MNYDTIIIGGGPGGLSAAIKAKELGLNVLLLDEKEYLGGILPQCIHPGFGLHCFKEDLTGPEFAHRLIEKVKSLNVAHVQEATALSISIEGEWKVVRYVSPAGLKYDRAKTIIYAAGARERHRFEIGIFGDRVPGVYTAGEAQTLMDLYGVMPGRNVVIVGSGDVGLIMARRFALEGAKVKAVVEILSYPGGLARNVVQCLHDFNIPLYLSHKVLEIKGKKRVERVKVIRVDEELNEIPGSEFEIPCDTVVISAGLVPRIKMLKSIGVEIDPLTGGPVVDEHLETTVPGIFVAGNALLINDLVDYVVEQGEIAALSAVKYIEGELEHSRRLKVEIGDALRFVVPQYVSGNGDVRFYARVKKPMENAELRVKDIGFTRKYPVLKPSEMLIFKLSGNTLRNMERITVEVTR